MKRIGLGVVALVAAAGLAQPASAHVWVERCYATVFYPCGVCVQEGPVYKCTRG